jgi:sialic acid synthase SpsE
MILRLGDLDGVEARSVVIAEIGTNHNRDFGLAVRLVDGAAAAGCDFVKFQIYEPDEIVSEGVSTEDYGWVEQYGRTTARAVFARHLQTPKEWIPELIDRCRALNVGWGATIHGQDGLRWAQETEPDFLKVASMDHTNLPLLRLLARELDVPILASLGMAPLDAVEQVADALADSRQGFGLLHCSALYPPQPESLNLGNIPYLRERFGVPIGYSDHTMGAEVAVAARKLGAGYFEKHITTDRHLTGPDHSFAMQLNELPHYVEAVRQASPLMARGPFTFAAPSTVELGNRDRYLKSVIARVPLRAGDVLSEQDTYLARPGTGIAPVDRQLIVGRRMARDVPAETPLQWGDLQSE